MSLDLEPDMKGMLPEKVSIAAISSWTALGASAALALSRPASAQEINTDSEGLAADDVSIPTSTGNLRGYRAMPAKGGPFPVVLVAAEIFGLDHLHEGRLPQACPRPGTTRSRPISTRARPTSPRSRTIADIMPDRERQVRHASSMSDLRRDASTFAQGERQGGCRRGSASPDSAAAAARRWIYAAPQSQAQARRWRGTAHVGGTDRTSAMPKTPIDLVERDQGARARASTARKDDGIPAGGGREDVRGD